jgi:peptide/nickel transport system ATP-binding protein
VISMVTPPLLTITDLKGCYKGWFGIVRAVDGVSLSIDNGKIVGLAGESGCGKSTLAHLISGTLPPLLHYESGKVTVDGFDIYSTNPELLRTEVKCKRMSFVPQASMDSLNPVRRISDFIMDVVSERTGKRPSKNEVLKIAGEHFAKLGLDKHVLDLYSHELSGGMKQRAVIAISTLWNPKLLVVDEPTSALDVTSQKLIIKLLLDLRQDEIVKSMLFITHDIPLLRQICDGCAVMYAGKIVETGTADEIINDPLHPYTRGLLYSTIAYNPKEEGKRQLKSISGTPPDLRTPPSGCRFHPRCEECIETCKTNEPPKITKDDREVSCWIYH